MLICSTYNLPVKMKTMSYHNHLPMIMFYLIFCCSVVSNALNDSFSSSRSIRCLPHQSSALLQLKAEFSFDHKLPRFVESGYPKMKFWKGGKDCCEWDGVRCSKEGQVVRLDLSLSWLQGPLLYNSSLFTLHQLQQLNLAFNYFNHSVIPSRFGHLSKLTHLNLSYSSLQGNVPSEIAWLSNLISLDLSYNYYMEIETNTLLQNMTKLRQLSLGFLNFSSASLESLANLSSLTSLFLYSCDLHSEFPKIIFQLPMIQDIDLSYNPYLTGSLPEFHSSSKLKSLILSDTSFYGKLPYSIGNLRTLNHLELCYSSFSGTTPSSIGNLSQLTYMSLAQNKFNGELPSTLGNLTKLTFLDLSYAGFSGKLPSSLGNLMLLIFLSIKENEFNGQIPSSLFTLHSLIELGLQDNQFTGRLSIQNVSSSQLTTLSLSGNKLNGPIPRSISKLNNLADLDLSSNNLSGRIELDIFSKLRKLRRLSLSDNSLSVTYIGKNSTLPKFEQLYLSSCSLGAEFPSLLRTQNELERLDISYNKIEGKIPKWFLNTSIDHLSYLNLSHNSISNWEQPPFILLPWRNLEYLDLQSNALQGLLVVPPLSIYVFFVSNNQLSGRIHPLFCNLTELAFLDVSNNHLSGSIPQCLGSSNNSLVLLNMKENNFSGKISHMLFNESNLKTLDLSDNQLQGKLPQSLIKCRALEVLNLGHNQIRDTFPFWLQNLPELQVLVLRSNKFYGPIWNPQQFSGFVKLRIVDLSFNNFSGKLPAEYFGNWTAMTMVPSSNKSELKYMGDTQGYYEDSVTLMNKGRKMKFVKILTIYISLDLSNNYFHGEIPSTIGDLQSLVVLNLSGNNFEGLIPSSLGNLCELESLDLSKNKLSGRIPSQLASLTFLAYLNLSENQLVGPIPEGAQFNTFSNSSFEGNVELCGFPLTKQCDNSGTPNPQHSQESESENGFGWKAVVMGYGCGFVIGVIVGHVVISRRPNFFAKIYGRRMW